MRNRAKAALATAGYSTNDTSAIAQLIDFAAQNSGIEFRNYYEPWSSLPNLSFGEYRKSTAQGRTAYARECRDISADWRRVKESLMQCAIDGVTDADVIAAAPRAFSGRLEWVPCAQCQKSPSSACEVSHWSYCTGQYWPTEYRKAVAAVLSHASHVKRRNRPPVVQMPQTICELKNLNRKNGRCWFDEGAMKFFGTRIESGVIAGHYFITSEQPPFGPRAFSVRSFDAEGNVDTVGNFAKAATKAVAMGNLQEHIAAQPIAA